MIIFNKDTERNNGRKDRAQDVRIDSLQTAVDELNADIAEIEITVENLSQSIDDKYAAQTQTLMSELNSRIQSLISNLEDFVNTAQVNADVGNFKNLYATVLSNLKNLTVDYATVTQRATIVGATITNETVTSSQIQSLEAATAVISELTATLLHITNLAVTELTAEVISSDGVISRLGQFSDLTVQEIADINLVTGSTLHSPTGAPDNTELLKITVPHYKGTVHVIDYDNSFNVTIYDNAFISWSQQTMTLYRVQKGFNSTELYFKDTDLNMNYKVLLVGSHYPVTVTSEIVDRTGIRQNVLTKNGVHGVAEGGSGGGSSIVFVDTFPAEGEDGVIYVSMTEGAKAWDDGRNMFISFVGSNLSLAVSDNTANIGTLSNLTTTEKTDLVGAVNEVESHADTNTANIGTLSSLTTTEKTTIVAAINEVDDHADTNASNISTIIGNDTGMSMREVAQDVSANVYIPCGSVLFANLPALSGLRVGDVYNIEDDFTTTADFIEGAGHVVKAGSNIVVIDSNNVKKWDVLGLGVDTSSFMTKADPTGTGSFSLNRKANTTVGVNSVAEGINCEASGAYSHAEGGITRASDSGAHAEGDNTVASAFCAHAEGNNSQATAYDAHAEGYSTEARGFCSHTEGWKSKATEQHSHAEGCFTLARSESQHVQGKYNVEDSNGVYADIVGNGMAANDRKNIEATTWTGDKRLKGTVYVGCNDDSTGGTDLNTAKADKVANATAGNLAGLDSNGNLTDSGIAIANVSKKEKKQFSDTINTLEFDIQNGYLHMFYSATYAGCTLFVFVIPQYNNLIFVSENNNGFIVTNASVNSSLKINIERDSWNTFPATVVHITF